MTTNRESLVSHLVYRLSNQTELVATHSLAYILNKSEAAKSALGDVLCAGGPEDIGPIERVAAEVDGDNEERVDLAAYNKLGEERVLIEAKFWAGLTKNQPGTYLDRLPKDDRPSVLLFVAPERRLPTLWGHVLQRAKDTDSQWETIAESGDLRAAVLLWRPDRKGVKGLLPKKQPFVRGNRWLMLTSWRALLGAMASRADIEGDGLAGEDIRQLNALCEQQDRGVPPDQTRRVQPRDAPPFAGLARSRRCRCSKGLPRRYRKQGWAQDYAQARRLWDQSLAW